MSPGGSYDGSHAVENSGKLIYNLWPLDTKEQRGIPAYNGPPEKTAPIAFTLLSLRSALMASATHYDYSGKTPVLRPWKPCFRDYDQAKPTDLSGDIYTVGLKVTNVNGVGLKVTLAGIVTLGASGKLESSTGHTLTVSFGQSGLKEVAAAIKKRKDACEKNPKSFACLADPGIGTFDHRGEVIQTFTSRSGRQRIFIEITPTPPPAGR